MARRISLLVALAFGAVSCGADASVDAAPPVAPSAYTHVSAFGVSALVPHGWVAQPAEAAAYYSGVTASPRPAGLEVVAGSQGLVATRLDATEVGAPSDLYYLAAKGPVTAGMTGGDGCTVTDQQVYVDRAPEALTGRRRSPGDFVASARGRCEIDDRATRWSYFVAAPGFGPAREQGIPGSGLYLILVSTVARPGAVHTLARVMRNVRFGDDGPQDFVHAVRAAA